MRLALYQPDIPPNTGTILRLAACMGLAVDIIEPCGFPFSEKSLRRSGLDYLDHVRIRQHLSFEDFQAWRRAAGRRLLLLSTKAAEPYTECRYQPDDILMVGRESSGVPDEVFEAVDKQIVIPMPGGLRSLNVAVAASMVLGEALRQQGCFEVSEDNTIGTNPRDNPAAIPGD